MRSSSHRGRHSEASSTRPGSPPHSSSATDTYRGIGADFRPLTCGPWMEGIRGRHTKQQKKVWAGSTEAGMVKVQAA